MNSIWKKVFLMFLSFMLVSCSANIKQEDAMTGLKNTLYEVAKSDTIAKANMHKQYYDYFLPFDMKKENSSLLSEQFRCGYETLVMNFRTIYFINDFYYDEISKDEEIVDILTEEEALHALPDTSILDKEENEEIDIQSVDFTPKKTTVKKATVYSGKYLANYDTLYNYYLTLRVDKKMCYMYLDADIAAFACYVPIVECEDMIYRMFHIVKSMKYDRMKIIKDYKLLYSLLKMEEEEEKSFYDDIIPESGYLEDLIQR